MRPRTKIFIGIGTTFVVLVAAMLIVGYFLVTKSFPQTEGTESIAGLQKPVTITRDGFGFPHIEAQNEHDLYVAAGFVHAQDRLWQMELIRRAGQGRLAEILGENALPVDRLFKTLKLTSVAHEIAERLKPETRAALEAYATGVNDFIATHVGKNPIEFDMLAIEPEEWKPEHSILLSKLMAWELNYSRWVDITFGYVVERVGEKRARELYPDWPSQVPAIVATGSNGKSVSELGRGLLNADRDFQKITGLGGFGSGSNSWVLAGSRTVTGKPILANDPHLLLTTPARWYEMHLVAPTLDVSGASLPGVPFIVIGRNRSIAWGLTNAMMDDEDFYIEEVDSFEVPTKYRVENEWKPITQSIDTILVKDRSPVIMTSYRTERGPVVNRIEPAAAPSPNLLTMRWTGLDVSEETETFYLLNRAGNWKEFRDAIRYFTAPAQNFIYADTAGNIGYTLGGKIPLRKVQKLASPFPGWTRDYDWTGSVPFDQNPHALNPPEGFIATANNRIVDQSYPYYISNQWEPSWRIGRIRQVLSSYDNMGIEDVQRLQLDVVSMQARLLVPIILNAYDSIPAPSEDVKTALNYFRNWTLAMREDDVATSLYQAFLVRIIHNTFSDELGPQIAELYDTLAARPLTAITGLLQADSSEWFDDVSTEIPETKNDMIRKSLEEGIEMLRTRLGGTLKEWRWGDLHQIEFSHVFGENKLLRSLFNVGPFPVGGSHSTVWKGDFRIGSPFRNFVGPSTRQIFDLADPNNTRAITPPGQSGQLYHKNYHDQVSLWLAGAYRKVPMDVSRVEQSHRSVLILEPPE